MENLGVTIKELREKNGLSQKDLADYLKIDPSSVSKYENGTTEVPLSKLELISSKFNMTTLDILAYPDQVIVNKQQSIKIKNIKQKAEELLRQINEL